MQQLEQIVESLRDDGCRITPQRMAIVDYLLKTEDHPSADLIHKIVRKKYPMVSLSTVYKTLDLLKEKKLVNEIEVDGEARFDAHTNEHINMVCVICGKIDDVDEETLKDIKIKASKKSKFLILKSNFELHGYCNSCKSKINSF
ncbi:Fur family transcriptional regulator [Nitrosopumilus sp.]|uniref:Fur family transcriptional regulator n=1 Tax=Nitrosopumilus sp. TaxID=2024843 RepID=UPI00247EEF85|nr:Fur family transcriptional regulator [Nitrosopumilus sp.]MCV0431089.1 transcriptional repressor [Nitrosopumilus sp.]